MRKYCNVSMYVKTVGITMSLLMLPFLQSVLAAEPINVCYTHDFSGNSASIGILQSKVVEMVVKDVNKAGGIKGRPINLIIQDNASDPSKAIGIAKMFKDQYKCKVILVDNTSTVCLALKSFADVNKIPMIASSPQADSLTDVNKKGWFFRTCSDLSMTINAGLARLKKLGYTKVAFEGSSLANGTQALSIIKELAPIYGIQLVYVVQVEPKTKDLSIQVRQMKDSGAQAVYTIDYEAETAVLARAIKAIGWRPYVIDHSAQCLFGALGLAPIELFESWDTIAINDPHRPLVKKIWKDVSAYMGKPCDEDEKAVKARDQVTFLVEALKVAKNLEDSTSIRDAFYNIDPKWELAAGRLGRKGGFTMDTNTLMKVEDMVLLTVRNGKFVTAR